MYSDFVDEKLDQLIHQAQQQPENSAERRQLLKQILLNVELRRRLIERYRRVEQAYQQQQNQQTLRDLRQFKQLIVWIMQQSRCIWRSKDDQETYQEALQKTWQWFFEKLNEYDPEKASFVTWFNKKLGYILQDIRKANFKEKKRRQQPFIKLEEDKDSESTLHLEDLYPQPDQIVDASSLLEQIHEWLEQESKILHRKHVPRRSDVHCYFLIVSRLPRADQHLGQFQDGKEWKSLVQELQTPGEATLTVEQLRRCYNEKCLPCLQKFLQSHGYRSPRKSKRVPKPSSSK